LGWNAAACARDFRSLALGADYVIDSVNSLEPPVSQGEYKFPAGNITGEVCSTDFFHRF